MIIDILDEEYQRAKIAEMSAICQEKILGGFLSNALGTSHLYPAKITDQANLSDSVLASILPDQGSDWSTPFWCCFDGVWNFTEHTAAQIQQVGRDAKVARLAAMFINQELSAHIMACETCEEVNAIKWPE